MKYTKETNRLAPLVLIRKVLGTSALTAQDISEKLREEGVEITPLNVTDLLCNLSMRPAMVARDYETKKFSVLSGLVYGDEFAYKYVDSLLRMKNLLVYDRMRVSQLHGQLVHAIEDMYKRALYYSYCRDYVTLSFVPEPWDSRYGVREASEAFDSFKAYHTILKLQVMPDMLTDPAIAQGVIQRLRDSL